MALRVVYMGNLLKVKNTGNFKLTQIWLILLTSRQRSKVTGFRSMRSPLKVKVKMEVTENDHLMGFEPILELKFGIFEFNLQFLVFLTSNKFHTPKTRDF